MRDSRVGHASAKPSRRFRFPKSSQVLSGGFLRGFFERIYKGLGFREPINMRDTFLNQVIISYHRNHTFPLHRLKFPVCVFWRSKVQQDALNSWNMWLLQAGDTRNTRKRAPRKSQSRDLFPPGFSFVV